MNKELLVIPSECFTQYDLSTPGLKDVIPEERFSLTISSEVAEHIDAKFSDAFMDNLTSFSDVILFSAAIPGQGGTHHVNEQWPSYWAEKFRARGFIPADCIRPQIWNDREIFYWYRQNMLLFVRENTLQHYPSLIPETQRPLLDIVHPEKWQSTLNLSGMGFKTLCRITFKGLVGLIPAFVRGVKRRLIA
ncbi:MAG: hypothetical protein IJP86_06205 [Synergistaceae bacterium]|nr:hypothetical protein [Synergistaceae bacterium]